MIKKIEQLDKEELELVKLSLESYLNQIDSKLLYLNKGINKINLRLDENNKESRKIWSKIIKINEKGNKKDNFWTVIGVILSGLVSVGMSFTTDELLSIMGVFGIGTIASFVAPEVELQTRNRRVENKYVDLEVINNENHKLKDVSNEVSDVINQIDEIKSFIK